MPSARASRAVLLDFVVAPREDLGRRLRPAEPVEHALVVEDERRRGPRVAPLPVRAALERHERAERAGEPWLRCVDAEVVVVKLGLELVRALLVDGSAAVALGAELRDHERLLRVAAVQVVEPRRQPFAIGQLAVLALVPAVVAVDAEDVDRLVALAADARVAGNRKRDRA